MRDSGCGTVSECKSAEGIVGNYDWVGNYHWLHCRQQLLIDFKDHTSCLKSVDERKILTFPKRHIFLRLLHIIQMAAGSWMHSIYRCGMPMRYIPCGMPMRSTVNNFTKQRRVWWCICNFVGKCRSFITAVDFCKARSARLKSLVCD